MNHCPVYLTTGGHAYGWVYPGPMGAVLTPQFIGIEQGHHLPSASTFCGRCEAVCPVRIPLPKLMRYWREQQFTKPPAARRPRATARGSGRSPRAGPALYHLGARLVVGAARPARSPAARPVPQPAARRRLDRDARHAGARGADLPGALARAERPPMSEEARDAVLERLRRALHRRGPGATEARNAVLARMAQPRPGLIPARAELDLEGRIQLFAAQAEAVQATVRRLRRYDALPEAVERYLRERNLPMRLVVASDRLLGRADWRRSMLSWHAGRAEERMRSG